jgi:diguanylate cyclase (GGDEF)-like protein
MAARCQRGVAGFGQRVLVAIALNCMRVCAAPADPEQGLPLVNTILPIRYNTPASPVGPQAFALAALRDGSIVIANNAGLLRLSGPQASAWNPTHGNVLSLASADDDTMYLGGIGEIGYFKEFGQHYESLAAWAPRLGFTFGDFWISVAARGGGAYFADATHVLRWDGQVLRLVYSGHAEMLQGAQVGNGVVVLDPGAGLVAIDGDEAHLIPGSERLQTSGPCALASAKNEIISVCVDGVSRWRADGASSLLAVAEPVRKLLASAGITTARMDEAGNLLVGTRRAGVLWLDDHGALSGHLAVPDWGESRVFSLLPRRADGFWVGLDYGVAHVEAPGQVARYDALLGLPRAIIATIRVKAELFAATTRGVYRLLPATADSAFARFESYMPVQTTLFAIAQSGGVLLIASGEGVYAVENGVSRKLDSELAYSVFALDDSGHSVLAGGLSGVRSLRNVDGTWQVRTLADIDSEIRHFERDRDGAIWATGNYAGVYRLHPEQTLDAPARVERFGVADGLPSGRVIPLNFPDGIVFDAADGLRRFDAVTHRFVMDAALMDLLPIAQGETRNVAIIDEDHVLAVQHDRVRLLARGHDAGWYEAFTPLARLPRGMDFRNVRADVDGTVWIAANEALFRHQPHAQATLPELPAPQIRIDTDHSGRDDAAAMQLGVAPRNVRARFEEGFFDGVEQLRFRSRLQPLESTWSEWQQSPEREMTHLSGGKYELVVQARDIFGRESVTASIAFTLLPPWYLRWWSFVLAALALLTLLALLIRRRDRRLRRRATELAELVRLRTQELEQASITDALTGLRNRHYVQLTGTPWHHGESAYWLIAIIDIDHFKRINDEHGHAAGDEILRAVAGRLSGALPSGAVAVRWGGEEFLIIVAVQTAANASDVVRRLLHAVGDDLVATSGAPPLAVTCSIGWDLVALDTTASLDMVLSSADHRLYDAKRGGRDRACGTDGSVLIRNPENL